jgi:DNA-binding MurR/RpiR family transcriptional regulator
MSSLLKIRAERDQMSAIERRIADFILSDAHLLRDYSSQQLANALGISQSSVVKFSQKLGFKGYPDLKFSIGEELARSGNGSEHDPDGDEDECTPSDVLWRIKSDAREETDLVNPDRQIIAAGAELDAARRVLVFGQGEDGLHAILFATRIGQLGLSVTVQRDLALVLGPLESLENGDVLFVLSEYGQQPGLLPLLRDARAAGARVISVTRHTANLLRNHADIELLVSAHASEPHLEAMAFRSAMQHLLDRLVLRLWQARRSRREYFSRIRERLHTLENP